MRLLLVFVVLLLSAPVRAEVTTAAAHGLLASWLDAQNRGDFAAYQALYAGSFSGVRRSGKRVIKLDRAGWIKDRERMFRRPMRVSAAKTQAQVVPGGVLLQFEQTWASGSYRDVGEKRMVVSEEGGQPRIAREELLASDIRPEPLGAEDAALVRCLFPNFDEVHRKVGGAQVGVVRKAASPPNQIVVVELSGRPTAVGVCGEGGKSLGLLSLPERDSFLDACEIMEATNCNQHEERLLLGAIKITPRFFEVSAGEWAFAVERDASADSSDEQGPGEEVHVTTLYLFRSVGGKLERILTLPSDGGRSDVELSDGFSSNFSQERPGELRLSRTVSKGVYPDGRKERTKKLRYKWNGRRLSGG